MSETTERTGPMLAGEWAWLHLDSWAGRQTVPVTVVGPTDKAGARQRVRLDADCLKGRAGTSLLVPLWALTRRD